jgi:hypothetical protein
MRDNFDADDFLTPEPERAACRALYVALSLGIVALALVILWAQGIPADVEVARAVIR